MPRDAAPRAHRASTSDAHASTARNRDAALARLQALASFDDDGAGASVRQSSEKAQHRRGGGGGARGGIGLGAGFAGVDDDDEFACDGDAIARAGMRAMKLAMGDALSGSDEDEDADDGLSDSGGDYGGARRAKAKSTKKPSSSSLSVRALDDDGRLRMRGPIEMEGAEYAGRSASRRDWERATRNGSDDEEDDEEEDGEDDESEEEDGSERSDDDAGGHEGVSDEEMEDDDEDEDPYADEDGEDGYVGFDADDGAKDSESDEDGDEDEDEEEEAESESEDAQGVRAKELLGAATEGDAELARELEAFRQEEEQTKKLVDTKTQHVEKGKAVKVQRTIWERALHVRIRLQKAMSGAAKLPTPLACRGLKRKSPEVAESLDALAKAARKTMRTLSSLQSALMRNIEDIPKESLTSKIDVDAVGDVDDIWAAQDASYRAYASYRDSTADRWYRKSSVSVGKMAGSASQNLKAFNQSISQQVMSTMRAPGRLIEKSRPPKRAAPARLGEAKVAGGGDEPSTLVSVDGLDDAEAREHELYDDVDFYEQLLKEFLEGGNEASAAGGGVSRAVKVRKNVDRKASKGRKLRYHVQEPLVNFMQADDLEIPSWAERIFGQLFASNA
mmetsp:Transcript_3550/g.12804  ORF Transcript_3550/g.12804 Transcript_3550/m.12804 type:complete len:618 (-) Transcript_3550:130-1983(-)